MTRLLRQANLAVISTFCAVLVSGSITIFPSDAFAQTYPTKPIRFLVTSAAGISTDIVARVVGGKLTEALGQQIIIDNRAGAAGRIGAEVAARAAPDGYTILIISLQQLIVEAMYKDLKYNIVKDFSPISLTGTVPFVLVVNPSIPATSVKDLVTLAKSRPGVLKYGSTGVGTPLHLSAEIFKFMTGIDILHVPYKEGPLTSLIAGEVNLSFQPLTGLLPMIKSGKVRALGITSANRTTLIPDLPSISETVPDYEFIGFYGIMAPAKTPTAILARLNTELAAMMHTSAMRDQMLGLGVNALGSSQKEFASFISKQLAKMREAVERSGASPEN